MARHILIRGFAAVGAFALVAVLAVTAFAQAAPLRVVQGSDGTLYLVQGGNEWTLVPDQITDADPAALNLSGEIDGTVPAQFLASAPPPAAAPAPAPAAPAAVDKLVGNYKVMYGAQSVVGIDGSGGGYTVTAKGPLHWKAPGVADTPICDIPDGTVIATFNWVQAENKYSGQHGNWDRNCQFVQWGTMILQLNGTLLSGTYNSPFGPAPVAFSPA